MTKPAPLRYAAFGKFVTEKMQARGISNSDLARAIWGTTTDYRGYTVAKNRDRIGHYRAGASYPEPENLAKLAEALEVPVAALELLEGARTKPLREPRGSMADTQITMLHAYPGVGSLQLRRFLTVETIMKIMQLLKEDKLPDGVG